MKKIIGLMILMISVVYGYSQFPTYPTVKQALGSKSTEVYSKGILSADSGYVQSVFSDTISANRGYIKNLAGITIRVVDTVYFRNAATTKWISLYSVANGSLGGSAWLLTGNEGTTAGTNFIGTSDSRDFVIKTSNTERARFTLAGSLQGGYPTGVSATGLAAIAWGYGGGVVSSQGMASMARASAYVGTVVALGDGSTAEGKIYPYSSATSYIRAGHHASYARVYSQYGGQAWADGVASTVLGIVNDSSGSTAATINIGSNSNAGFVNAVVATGGQVIVTGHDAAGVFGVAHSLAQFKNDASGSYLFGVANDVNSRIQTGSSAIGSLAGGYANAGDSIYTNGQASLLWGKNLYNIGNYSFLFGNGLRNEEPNCFKVGWGQTVLSVNDNRVGINTDAPDADFHLNGNAHVEGESEFEHQVSINSGDFYLLNGTANLNQDVMMPGLTNAVNATDSMMVVDVSNGMVGYRAIPETANTWKLTGNTGIDSSVNWFGTNTFDGIPIMLRSGGVRYGQWGGDACGNGNVAIGYEALNLANSGGTCENVAFGYHSLYVTSGGQDNVGVGTVTLAENTTGSNNTALGNDALSTNTTGSNNTGLGHSATVMSAALTYATAIGANSRVGQSNSMSLGDSANIKVGIGTAYPSERLHVRGEFKLDNASEGADKVLTSDANGLSSWAKLTNSNLSGSAAISNANLANSTISGIALGSNLADLTASTGLTGTTYNGGTARTWTNNLSTGVSGGQTAIGGTGVTDVLSLKGTTGNGTAASPAIQFLVGNNGATTAATILNNGRIGIGLTNPVNPLDIYMNSSDASQNIMNIYNPNTAGKSVINVNGDVVSLAFGVYNSLFPASVLRNIAGFFSTRDLGLYGSSNSATGGAYNIVFSPGGYQDEKMRFVASGSLLIGTTTEAASSILTMSSTTRGLLMPRMTTTQRDAISSPAAGLIIENNTSGTNVLEQMYDGTRWTTTAKTLTNTATLDFSSTAAQTSAELTITVTGAADGDAVSLGIPTAAVNANATYTAYVSSTNTVTVKFNNYSSGSIDPASATFRVAVLKY